MISRSGDSPLASILGGLHRSVDVGVEVNLPQQQDWINWESSRSFVGYGLQMAVARLVGLVHGLGDLRGRVVSWRRGFAGHEACPQNFGLGHHRQQKTGSKAGSSWVSGFLGKARRPGGTRTNRCMPRHYWLCAKYGFCHAPKYAPKSKSTPLFGLFSSQEMSCNPKPSGWRLIAAPFWLTLARTGCSYSCRHFQHLPALAAWSVGSAPAYRLHASRVRAYCSRNSTGGQAGTGLTGQLPRAYRQISPVGPRPPRQGDSVRRNRGPAVQPQLPGDLIWRQAGAQ